MTKNESAWTGGAARAVPASRLRAELNLLAREPPADHSLDLLALAFGLPPPPTGVREAAAQVMAELIEGLGPVADPRARRAALDDLLLPVVETAVAACRAANEEHEKAVRALAHLREARTSNADQRLLNALKAGTSQTTLRAAELLIAAHIRSEEARGAARAVSLARRNKLAPCAVAEPLVEPWPDRAAGSP